MPINQLQIPGYQLGPDANFTSLANLGKVYQQAQNQQKLSDLGRGLADGTIDYKQAAAASADMGDLTHSLQFLALSEQKQKQADELKASADFRQGLPTLYGANPAPAVPSSNPMPVVGARSLPAVAPGAPVPSTSSVIGDAEGVAKGLYDAPASAGSRPPMQVASSGDALPNGMTPRALALIAASSNPRLPQGDRETVKTLLGAELDNSKATPDMKEWAFAKYQDPNTPDYTTWSRANKAAGKTEVNVDTKAESALKTKLGGGLGERINDIAKEGDAARTDLAMVGQLRDLGAAVQTGAPAAIQGWLANNGIKVGPNVGAIEAYGSIVDKLTPNQHVPGSGSSSNLDVKMFKSSLPRLINTPEGNTIIENTLAGLAQYKLDRAAIAEKVQTGELEPKDGIKAMRELSNPYDNFKTFAKSGFKADPNNPASQAAPPQKDGVARVVPSTRVEIDQSLANARAAIARNPGIRDAVIQRLKDAGIDAGGL